MNNFGIVHGGKPNDADVNAAEEELGQFAAILRLMVDKPTEIEMEFVKSDRTIVIRLRAAKGDFGKLIGKQGKTINSLRTLMNNVAAKHGVRAILELDDE